MEVKATFDYFSSTEWTYKKQISDTYQKCLSC